MNINVRLLAFACTVVVAAGVWERCAAADDGCVPDWDVTIGESGMSGGVAALIEYNGDLIAGGSFLTAGGQTVNHIARWDGSQWHPFVSNGHIGVSSSVRAMVLYNGDLIVGGWFSTAGGQTVNRIARWDGFEWHPFIAPGGAIGVGGDVNAMTVYKGDLIVGGPISAGGKTVLYIARWDGSDWHAFESGGQIGVWGSVQALTVLDGDLIVGGDFSTAGNQTVNRIARWDGSDWHAFESGGQIGVLGGPVHALTVFNGDLILGGIFSMVGGITGTEVNFIVRWDGVDWHPMESGGQTGVGSAVFALNVYGGDLHAGGKFYTAGGQMVKRVVRWDGSQWHPLGDGEDSIGVDGPFPPIPRVLALHEFEGDLVVGGIFQMAGSDPAYNIATWRGCPPKCPAADLTGNCSVGVADLLILLGAWGECADCEDCIADLTGDCTVGVADLLELLANWQ